MSDLGIPRVGTPGPPAPERVRFLVGDGRAFALSVFDLGLACCAVEFAAAVLTRPDFVPPAPSDDDVEVLVVSGTVTDKMAPLVRGVFEQAERAPYVVSFGSCANSGGPYWDSYCVTKGVDQLFPVDVYVPGCPPRPEALVHGLRTLARTIEAAP